MRSTSPLLGELARAYIGGLAHVHTKLSNHPNHQESDLNVTKIVDILLQKFKPQEPPLDFILINEHPSDPDKPRPLGRFSRRGRRLLRERRRVSLLGVPLLYGLEVSILPNGKTDLTTRLADNCAAVIASRHRLPTDTERDPEHIMRLFYDMCHDKTVDVIGHPLRYIEQVPNIDWAGVFRLAAQTNTVIELNFNNFPDPVKNGERKLIWDGWLKQLAQSKAPVMIGMDIHSEAQLRKFAEQWQGLDAASPNKLASFIVALNEAGIAPDRVISSSRQRLRAWISIDKADRGQLS